MAEIHFSVVGKWSKSMTKACWQSWMNFEKKMVNIILNGISMTQIHIDFGRKFPSVGVHQERW
jgi:hypothetical protein